MSFNLTTPLPHREGPRESLSVIYEDNHIIIVNKESGEIVQGDKTGDTPLSDIVKQYIKERYHKPGEVFLGVVHRLDRPVSGLVIFARTSKALTRLNRMFANGEVHKTYWAITTHPQPLSVKEGSGHTRGQNNGASELNTPLPHREGQGESLLTHYLTRNEQQNSQRPYG